MMKKFDQTILSLVSRPLLPVVHLWFFVSLFTVEGAVLKERWPGLGGKKTKNKTNKNTLSCPCPCLEAIVCFFLF